VTSRQKAQGLILAGTVLVDDSPLVKPGQQVHDDCHIRLRGENLPYVSRGGLKLAAALEKFEIPVAGKVALDIGASTGGFTHVLLLKGVQKVYAIDVGHNQMDWKIRTDPRVCLKEKLNARYLQFDQIGEQVDVIVVDVSFISLEKILPALIQFSHLDSQWITLIKPQFEVGRQFIGKGGIVNSEEARNTAIEKILKFCNHLGLKREGIMDSPILGAEGNKEFLAYWKACI
jgi:23S rRNA (cytidine1920-2'-O)/16S rRNA (cytidine1409-2'-O)-methyltransferase